MRWRFRQTRWMVGVLFLCSWLSVAVPPAWEAVPRGGSPPGRMSGQPRGEPHMSVDTSALQPTLRCARAAGEVRVDGVLDDDGWRGVPQTDSFLNWNARGLPQYPTVARLTWDYRLLYVAVLCKDADIHSPYRQRDEPITREDAAGILIGPEGFPDRYFEIAVSPANVLFDARVFDPGPPVQPEIDRTWNARRIRTAVKVDGTLDRRGDKDRGWTLEMAIPFVELGLRRPPEPGDGCRINLYRIDRGPEPSFALWSPTLGTAPNRYQPERFGFLEFSS